MDARSEEASAAAVSADPKPTPPRARGSRFIGKPHAHSARHYSLRPQLALGPASLFAPASDRHGWRECRKCRSIFRPASAVQRMLESSSCLLYTSDAADE